MMWPRPQDHRARLLRGLTAAALFLCLSLHVSAAFEADTVTVSAEGSAAGAGAVARTTAVDNAQREAVLEVLQEFVPSRDFSLLYQLIDSAPRYVYSFRIEEQRQEDDGTWVTIEANVKQEQLRRDAADIILHDLHELPTVLVLTADHVFDQGPYLGKPENKSTAYFREFFAEHGVPEVERSELAVFHETEELYAFLEAGREGMTRLGRTHDAEAVLYGETRQWMGEPSGANVTPVHASVEMYVLRATGGEVIETVETEATVHGAEPRRAGAQALEDACAKAMEKALVAIVLAAFETDEDDVIRVTLEDLDHEEQMDEVIEALQAASGVEPEVLYRGASHARLHLPYDGSMARLTDRVLDQSYDGFHIRARTIVGRTMTLYVVEDGR